MDNFVGSLEVGKLADFIVFDFDNYKYLVYNSAINNLKMVFKKGNRIL
jgi:imidazolonepropionase-like amidohydrolase